MKLLEAEELESSMGTPAVGLQVRRVVLFRAPCSRIGAKRGGGGTGAR